MIRYRLHNSQSWQSTIVHSESNPNVSTEQKYLEGFNSVNATMSCAGISLKPQGCPVDITAVLLDHSYAASQNCISEADIKPDLTQVVDSICKEVKVADANVKVIKINDKVTQTVQDFPATKKVKVIFVKKKTNNASNEKVEVIHNNVEYIQTGQTFPALKKVKVVALKKETNNASDENIKVINEKNEDIRTADKNIKVINEKVEDIRTADKNVKVISEKVEDIQSADEKVEVITENVENDQTTSLFNLPTYIDPSMNSIEGTNDVAAVQVKDIPKDVKDTSQTEGQGDSATNHCMAGMNNLIVTVTDPKESSMFIKLDDDLANAIADLPMLNGKLATEEKESSDPAKNGQKSKGGNEGTGDGKKEGNEDKKKEDKEMEIDDSIGELEEIELTDLRGDSVLGDIIGEIERRPWECGHCGKMFTYKHNLQTHMLLHNTGPKPLQCPDCQRRFLLPHHLRIHRRHAHTGLRPYVCPDCGMGFTQSSNLKRHRETHMKNREKKYRCKVCGKRFFEAYHLERHKVSHTSDRPYVCNFCSARFKRKEHLQRHEEIHTKENGNTYPCVHCKRVFSRRQAYEKHCLVCEESVISSDTTDDDDDDDDDDNDKDDIDDVDNDVDDNMDDNDNDDHNDSNMDDDENDDDENDDNGTDNDI